MKARAEELLGTMVGPDAAFREGQWEAISALVLERSKVLVVQRTGWGKSLVYFIAAKLLRESGRGPTLLISPLLSLMRNQIEAARSLGINARSINSANDEEWTDIEAELAADQCDVLIVSPERLSNDRFRRQTLPTIQAGIGLFVVDEAHCISDWGHDFRPDYRRIVRIVQRLPKDVPLLATTATANERVVNDIVGQLGTDLVVFRGPLERESLRLQVIELPDQAERLAWLAEHVPGLPGSGIIYCLTVSDTNRVADWLFAHGIKALEYHAGLRPEARVDREQALLRNDVKVLVATVALGMGFDKPDLGFVIHFQRPGSLVAYYQQVGRAGRAIDQARGILLVGQEDDEIIEYFIGSAFPPRCDLQAVLDAIESENEISKAQLSSRLNVSDGRLAQCLTILEIDGAISKGTHSIYSRTLNPWTCDEDRIEGVTRQRRHELDRIRDYSGATSCLMEFIVRELDDPAASPCGRCTVCVGDGLPFDVHPELVAGAVTFLKRSELVIEPRKRWPSGGLDGYSGSIAAGDRVEVGRAMCFYGDAGWGRLVASGKYETGRFADELVDASYELVATIWKPDPPLEWVTAVPSMRRPGLVPDFARRLAARLELPYEAALSKYVETPEQKTMHNSDHQLRNLVDAIVVVPEHVRTGPVLLVDDMIDSRWTITLCGRLLRRAGASIVFPFGLARATGSQ